MLKQQVSSVCPTSTSSLQYSCSILVAPELFEVVKSEFPRFFGIGWPLLFSSCKLQPATTAFRYHLSRSKDGSNVSSEDVFAQFADSLFSLQFLSGRDETQPEKNTNFVFQGFLGM